ncbi:MAG: acyl-CoA dehydrogenase family protein, partial [Bdellovibrionales bacterium]|nr:acyl-CoA dehydrogenase family protein [Bdellovibrionales bacterium]
MSWLDGYTFDLDEETLMIQETARTFAQSDVAPLAAKIDQEHYYPAELIPRMSALGFMGALIPEEYGGSG